jgi:hypothetical protein
MRFQTVAAMGVSLLHEIPKDLPSAPATVPRRSYSISLCTDSATSTPVPLYEPQRQIQPEVTPRGDQVTVIDHARVDDLGPRSPQLLNRSMVWSRAYQSLGPPLARACLRCRPLPP